MNNEQEINKNSYCWSLSSIYAIGALRSTFSKSSSTCTMSTHVILVHNIKRLVVFSLLLFPEVKENTNNFKHGCYIARWLYLDRTNKKKSFNNQNNCGDSIIAVVAD